MKLLKSAMLALSLLFAAPHLAEAAERVDYTQAKFDEAAAAGKPVLVEVWAAWCPVCRAQDPLIKAMLKKPQMANVIVLSVDFDKDKELLRKFGVTRQSTLIAFKSGKEVDRSIGDTSATGIESLANKAL